MSLRSTMLQYLARHGESTLDDLQAGIGESQPKRVLDNLTHAVKAGLVARQKDIATGQPSYKLTKVGETAAKAPPGAPDTKQSECEIPVSETGPATGAKEEAAGLLAVIADIRAAIGDPEGRIMLSHLARHIDETLAGLVIKRQELLALLGADDNAQAREAVDFLRRKVHDLTNDTAAARLVLGQLAERLQVEAFERIPAAVDELMHDLATRAVDAQPAQAGPLALLWLDAEDSDLTYLAPNVSDDEAAAMALSQVADGDTPACLVLRVLGEARREARWCPLMAPAIETLHAAGVV